MASRNVSRETAFSGHIRRAVFGVAIGAMVACTPLYRDHGYAPTEAELSAVTVGKDTRETVATAIGRPSASGVLNENQWFYVQSRYKLAGARAPKEIDRQVLVISFNEAGTVSNIERFGLEDGKVVALSRRVTESNIKGVTFIGQLLSNFGRVTADQLIR